MSRCGTVGQPAASPPPPALPGFERINRFWDPRLSRHVAKIAPGEYYVCRGEELVTTVLGSCIAACIRDPRSGYGGMNHFMLPCSGKSRDETGASAAMRYGSFAMEHLINDIVSRGDGSRVLEIKVFGGGQVLPSNMQVGRFNVEFVLDFLEVEGLPLLSKCVGGSDGRKVIYDPSTGRAWVKKLRTSELSELRRSERRYEESLRRDPVEGEIELF